MAKIDEMLTNYGLESTTTIEGKTIPDLAWNWKVMMENFNDPYHASRLHGALQTFAPSHMNDFLEWDDSDGAIGRIQHFTEIDSSFQPDAALQSCRCSPTSPKSSASGAGSC